MPISLPLELYRPIVKDVEHKYLFALNIVSRVFQAEAEARIYRTVTLKRSSTGVVVGCRQVITTARFQPLIRVLRIVDWSSADLKLAAFRSLLASLLLKLTNPTSLRIDLKLLQDAGRFSRTARFNFNNYIAASRWTKTLRLFSSLSPPYASLFGCLTPQVLILYRPPITKSHSHELSESYRECDSSRNDDRPPNYSLVVEPSSSTFASSQTHRPLEVFAFAQVPQRRHIAVSS
jgi:hypothetical protein